MVTSLSERGSGLVVPVFGEISALGEGYRHPSASIPLQISINDEFIPADKISREEHLERRDRCERWLLEREVIDKSGLNALRRLSITPEGYAMIRDNNPADYYPLLFAYSLSDESHYEAFGKLLWFEKEEGRFDRFDQNQCAWLAVSTDLFRQRKGRWPTETERWDILLNEIRRPFRIYFVLKEEAIGEKVNYDWNRDLVNRVRRAVEPEPKKEIFLVG